MNEEKTFEVFEEIGVLLRSVRGNDPESWMFHPTLLTQIANKTKTAEEDIETILLALSNIGE